MKNASRKRKGNQNTVEDIKEELLENLERFYRLKREERFVPGKTVIHYAQAIYDHHEVYAIVDSILSGWWGLGKRAEEFEKEFSRFLGSVGAVLTNSGSSANLLAVCSLKIERG